MPASDMAAVELKITEGNTRDAPISPCWRSARPFRGEAMTTKTDVWDRYAEATDWGVNSVGNPSFVLEGAL
jgi:hypothetical protein